MNDITIRQLNDFDFDAFHACWLTAYGDYRVPTQLSKEDLKIYTTQNGVDFEASAGAFAGDKMIGFIVNGLRDCNGILTAYDAGTAIFPEHRGKGIFTKLFAKVETTFKRRGIKRYVLEVICDNIPAYNSYLNSGFKVSRKFDCLEAINSLTGKKTHSNITITKVRFEDCLPLIADMIEYEPSWHNLVASIEAIKETTNAYIAKINDHAVGYAIFSHRSRGRLLQIGVTPKMRENNVYEALAELGLSNFADGQKIRAVNLPDEAVQTKKALGHCGFAKDTSQFEMIKIY